MAKWGIPEKSMKNVAQRCWSEVRKTLQSKVMAKIDFCIYIPLYFTLWAKKISNTFSGQVSDPTQMSKCLKLPKNQESKGLYPWGVTWTKTTHAIVRISYCFTSVILGLKHSRNLKMQNVASRERSCLCHFVLPQRENNLIRATCTMCTGDQVLSMIKRDAWLAKVVKLTWERDCHPIHK